MAECHLVGPGIANLAARGHAVDVEPGIVAETDVGLAFPQKVHHVADAPMLGVDLVQPFDILDDMPRTILQHIGILNLAGAREYAVPDELVGRDIGQLAAVYHPDVHRIEAVLALAFDDSFECSHVPIV